MLAALLDFYRAHPFAWTAAALAIGYAIAEHRARRALERERTEHGRRFHCSPRLPGLDVEYRARK